VDFFPAVAAGHGRDEGDGDDVVELEFCPAYYSVVDYFGKKFVDFLEHVGPPRLR
jgi:hypothetical protein